ncbi:hypothetical protein IFM89_027956 [Coptis chinensis]|uniref:AP2/ERF domain-containing protein n=1 Tax=Coptis chinensis TaxID=261450 RepID=A0A835IGI8_9MAGN|nr:hypothetical protein IFM89_027956 [Coptis chinensis]
MGSPSNKAKAGKRGKTLGPFKGVRMRTWGRWVSEIRVPQSKERIWLGSYDTAEMAARAYDAALYCLRGSKGKFNFPDDERPEIPGDSLNPPSTTEIKAVAARFASPDCMSVEPSTPAFTAVNPPKVVDRGYEVENTFDVCESFCGSGVMNHDTFFADSFLLDEPFTLDPDSIWSALEETTNFSDSL